MHARGRGATAIGILAMVLHGSIKLWVNKKEGGNGERKMENQGCALSFNLAHEDI